MTSGATGMLEKLADEGGGKRRDDSGYRAEFIQLVKQAKAIRVRSYE